MACEGWAVGIKSRIQTNEVKDMSPNRELHCWEIIKCRGTEDCPARKHPEKLCWEIAREMNDYRSVFKICQDCVVFMLKNGKIALSEMEIGSLAKCSGCRQDAGLHKDK
jgi:hypothetical protein